jgi:hypothetical protein
MGQSVGEFEGVDRRSYEEIEAELEAEEANE